MHLVICIHRASTVGVSFLAQASVSSSLSSSPCLTFSSSPCLTSTPAPALTLPFLSLNDQVQEDQNQVHQDQSKPIGGGEVEAQSQPSIPNSNDSNSNDSRIRAGASEQDGDHADEVVVVGQGLGRLSLEDTNKNSSYTSDIINISTSTGKLLINNLTSCNSSGAEDEDNESYTSPSGACPSSSSYTSSPCGASSRNASPRPENSASSRYSSSSS